MITTVHPALDVRIFHREAKTLAEAGLAVCIVGQHETAESVDGVWIEPLPKYCNRWNRLMLGWTAFQLGIRLGAKLFIFHDPELFWVAVLLVWSGRKVVYDCHENLPAQLLQKDWIPGPIRRALVPLVWGGEWLLSRLVSGVIVARDAVQPRFPSARTVLVRNFPTAGALQSLSGGSPLELRRNIVIYAGVLSEIRGIRELVRAFDGPELAKAELFLVGEFDDEKLKDEILRSMAPNVRWLGRKSYGEVLQLYRSAKIGTLLLYPTPSHRHSLPVKLFEYLGAGLPVIASNLPEFADVIGECGALVNPLDVTQIRNTLKSILDLEPDKLAALSIVARNRVLTSFTWEPEGRRLLSFCSALLGASSHPALKATDVHHETAGESVKSRVLVSVVMPLLNEGRIIESVINSLLNQDLPQADLEIVVVDGRSSDGTVDVVRAIARRDPRVRLLINEKQRTPFALNIGLRAARGKYVCIFGAHTIYDRNYISTCLEELAAHGAVACSGQLISCPANQSLQAQLVAWALAHSFGSSGSSVRTQRDGFVDTVPYPVVLRDALLEVGGYDETLHRNQDNDTNQKLRARGYKLYLTSKTKCSYFVKPSLRSLAKYSFNTGFWNFISLRRNASSMALRHFIPFVFVLALCGAGILAVTGLFSNTPQSLYAIPFFVILGLHLLVGFISAVQVSLRENTIAPLLLPVVFLLFHLSYGAGTLCAAISSTRISSVAKQTASHFHQSS